MKMYIRLSSFFSMLVLISQVAFSQTNRTNTTAGSLWFDGGAGWSSGVPISTSNVTFNNNAKATILNGESATILSLVTGNGAVITINSGGSLTISGSMTTNNNTVINVDGNLTINGSLAVNNNLTWNITGTVTINGSVSLANNASLTVSNTGSMAVAGSFSGGTNTAVTVDGSVSIGGNLSVGNGSTIAGTGTMSVSGSCTDGTSTFCGTGPLPVKLIYFNASLIDGKTSLSWSTASQLNFSHFEIENSSNGSEWKTIGSVAGAGTTNSLNAYSYSHNTPSIGKNYYRLKMVDLDGTIEYSSVEAVVNHAGKSLTVSPNPLVGHILAYELNFTPQAGDNLIIYDITGAKVATIQITDSKNTIELPGTVKSGTYIVKYFGNGNTLITRLMVN